MCHVVLGVKIINIFFSFEGGVVMEVGEGVRYDKNTKDMVWSNFVKFYFSRYWYLIHYF